MTTVVFRMSARLLALALNLAVAAGDTLVCHLRGIPGGAGLTDPSDYAADEGDPTVRRMPGLIDGLPPYHAKHAR